MIGQRRWVPLVLGLLVAMLLGPTAAPAAEPRTTTVSLVIPAAAFTPVNENIAYDNDGLDLTVDGAGGGTFVFALAFPVQIVTIQKLTLYARDNDGAQDAAVSLWRTYPAGATETMLGSVQTSLASSALQTRATTAISPRKVDTALHGAYLWLWLPGPNVTFYGVKIAFGY